MKVSHHEGSDLRRVLIAMVTTPAVCARIATQWKPEGLFDTPWANLVGGWCVRHLNKYGTPPNGNLSAIFENWAAKHEGESDTVKSVERFLQALSDESEVTHQADVDFLLDVSAKYFNKVRLRNAIEQAQLDLDDNAVEDASTRLTAISRVELGVGAMVKPPLDYDVWQATFEQEERVRALFEYPNQLGKFFGDTMQRGTLLSFMAADKVGKSWWLLDLAYRAARKRNRVAYIDAGDATQEEVLDRLGRRATRLPKWRCDVRLPISIGAEGVIEHDLINYEAVTAQSAYKAFRRICGSDDRFRLSCYPNSTMTVAGIDGILSDWQRSEDWRPDVVVIDYADILAPPAGIRDGLEQIDEIWKQLRRLSQARHCLVVTATQANAGAYTDKKGVLTRRNFSGRKTKLAHVNGMIGINQTPDEAKDEVVRLNWIVRRKGKFSEKQVIYVAGCLDVGCPSMISSF